MTTTTTSIDYDQITNPQKKSLAFLKSDDFGLASHDYDPSKSNYHFDVRLEDDDSLQVIAFSTGHPKGVNDRWAMKISKMGKIEAYLYPYHVNYNDDPDQFYGITFK